MRVRHAVEEALTVIVAGCAWKGSFSAAQAVRALERGVRAALRRVRVLRIPVADGGDGTAEIVGRRFGGAPRTARVHGPLRDAHLATWFRAPGGVAVLDLASACGIRRLGRSELRPLSASTRGLGELVREALDHGARTIWIGLGGSASLDGGAGAAAALGARFLDAQGRELPDGGGALPSLTRVDRSAIDPRMNDARVLLLCDVRTPLLGPHGAARVFGPQKGADASQIRTLEAGLARFVEVVAGADATHVASLPGGGAAGGTAAGLMCLLGARLLEGGPTVLDLAGFDANLAHADGVVCGEGRYDGGYHAGKVNDEIVRRATRFGAPVAIVCGSTSVQPPEHPSVVTVCGSGHALDERRIARLASRATRRLLRRGLDGSALAR